MELFYETHDRAPGKGTKIKKPGFHKGFIMSLALFFSVSSFVYGQKNVQTSDPPNVRQHLLMDKDWRFAYGNSKNVKKDFNFSTGYFSYLAKAGYGDGPAAPNFDDRSWRKLNLPHDWAVELPFSPKADYSHGYKPIGHKFPGTSIGWYRKTFFIPESDLGKYISIQFDGVYRDAKVFVNGFYLGEEHSGYLPFRYDITDYLNYNAKNVVAVRVDATMQEGWFYEGAGIYRDVWLNVTAPLHVAHYGTYVTSEVKKHDADVTVRTTIDNDSYKKKVFGINQTIINIKGNVVVRSQLKNLSLNYGHSKDFYCILRVNEPNLWGLKSPYLYKLVTTIVSGDSTIDRYVTPFGIRTIRFDPIKGFFLNGKHVELKGTDNHQDAGGVGVAVPDVMQAYRVRLLKAMGSNFIRCAHNPPAPAFLDACDRLGMLVIDENRETGTSATQLGQLKRMILRDRNHPSVILWSLGNEEWKIEGNILGVRIARKMQAYAESLDSTRKCTFAISGGWDNGTGRVIEVMGYNYILQGNIDEHHAKFPWQPAVGTEESTTHATRGIYVTNAAKAHMAPTNPDHGVAGTEFGWKYYAARPFLAGVCFWTGFDYRGEPYPYGWPQVTSQYGLMDLCGFPKDSYFYLKSWWGNKPVLHVFPPWNHKGKAGKSVNVIVYSNCHQVELFLNHKSLGRKTMPKNSHLEWQVIYEPGTLTARGYNKNGKENITTNLKTPGKPAAIKLTANRTIIKADGRDVSVIRIQVNDAKAHIVPDADNKITFHITGPGKIIGVGNGDPSSHEKEQFVETDKQLIMTKLRYTLAPKMNSQGETLFNIDDSHWKKIVNDQGEYDIKGNDSIETCVIRGEFNLPKYTDQTVISLWPKSLCEEESVYVNGHLIASHIKRGDPVHQFKLSHSILRKGKNIFSVIGKPLKPRYKYDVLNTDPGIVQVKIPAGNWTSSAFNGLAQVIIQSKSEPGNIVLTATSKGLSSGEIEIHAQKVPLPPSVPDIHE